MATTAMPSVVPASVATSAPAPSPAPSTPSAPAPPSPPPASGAPEAPKPAESPAAPAPPPARPKQEDFPNNQQGLEDYVEANEKWKLEHPDEPAVAKVEEPKPGEAPKPEAAKPAEAEPKAGEAPKAATPQAIDEWTGKDAAFKAALDANPALKGELMETARAAERAKPVLSIVPTVEDAKFAVETSNRFVGLQHKFAMATEMPEVGQQAMDDFLSMFHVVDDKGEPVKDAAGNPKMTESFDFLTRNLTGGLLNTALTDSKSQIAALKQKVETATYPTEAAREADRATLQDMEYDVAAFDYVSKKLLQNDDEYQLPELGADATPAQKELQERLRKDVDAANANKMANSKAERVKSRAVFETKMNQSYAGGIGQYLDNFITEAKARGEYIPDLILNQPWINPATGVATKTRDFGMRMALEFKAKTESIPTIKNELLRLEALGPAGEAARVAKYAELRARFLPDIVRNYIDMVQGGVRQMSGQSKDKQQALATVARVEPSTGGGTPPAPPALSGTALYDKAREQLAAEPEYQRATRVDRAEMETIRAEEIRAGRK